MSFVLAECFICSLRWLNHMVAAQTACKISVWYPNCVHAWSILPLLVCQVFAFISVVLLFLQVQMLMRRTV